MLIYHMISNSTARYLPNQRKNLSHTETFMGMLITTLSPKSGNAIQLVNGWINCALSKQRNTMQQKKETNY